NKCRDLASERVQAAAQGVGGHAPVPHEAGKSLVAHRVPVDALESLGREQKVSRERVGGCLVPVSRRLADPVVMMTQDQMAKLVSKVPVRAEPVARGGDGDDRSAADGE